MYCITRKMVDLRGPFGLPTRYSVAEVNQPSMHGSSGCKRHTIGSAINTGQALGYSLIPQNSYCVYGHSQYVQTTILRTTGEAERKEEIKSEVLNAKRRLEGLLIFNPTSGNCRGFFDLVHTIGKSVHLTFLGIDLREIYSGRDLYCWLEDSSLQW